ncbi:hypothetical protein CCR97_13710 [Rhodoplanes elegans]|uniref:histidine kinase n=1 Tax=Rhodoplanes elegans TaxID=29408 RepID=A0A327KWZ2_9BRAD|nr:two-component system VirA-like sensor kinase [Rhodoplanes elegans]MBK5959256.1 hypothetical protein [Rhodoplanes elegans]RAI42183.1 hypothetical protein CH338_00700 [Rhodoplanes elegans]
MKATAAVTAVLLLLLLLTGLWLRGLDLDTSRYGTSLRTLDEVAMAERALQRDVVTARAGLLRNYDSLSAAVSRLDDAVAKLRDAAIDDSERMAAIDDLERLIARQGTLVERFKSSNALLQNSLSYFGLFSARLAASDRNGPVIAATTSLAAAMLNLTLDTSPDAAAAVKQRLDALRALRSPDNEDAIHAVSAHGEMLHATLPATDALVKEVVSLPVDRAREALAAIVVRRQDEARASANRSRALLFAISVLLVAALVQLGRLLHRRASELRSLAAAEHVIAGVSTRLVGSRPDEIDDGIVGALEAFAGIFGADRAYVVTAGSPPEIHRWARPGLDFPSGWPEQAIGLGAWLNAGAARSISLPQFDRLPPGPDRTLLSAVAPKGWFCTPSTNGWSRLLGYDAVRSESLSESVDGVLGRMAFDVVANALDRQQAEQERVRLEAILQRARRMETLGAFASGIAHNFNNIVAAILGYAEIAGAQAERGTRLARSLAEIQRASERARDLVDQILTFGRRGEMPRTWVSVTTLVDEARSLLAASLPAHVRLDVRITESAGAVLGDPVQLQQVVLNLCNNAAQAMDGDGRIVLEAGLQVRMTSLRDDGIALAPGPWVLLSVSDTGRGMSAATLERIFEPFFTTRPEGNGLGLATVREIVREHGGTVIASSTRGVGSRFEVWLPSAGQEDCDAVSSRTPVGHGEGETVLLISPEREHLLHDEEMLAALGYEPVGFADPTAAVAGDGAVPSRFDLALVCQPDGSRTAADAAAMLHRLAPELPIVVAIHSAIESGSASVTRAGICDIVHYPLVSDELAETLARCIPNPRSRRHRTSDVETVD